MTPVAAPHPLARSCLLLRWLPRTVRAVGIEQCAHRCSAATPQAVSSWSVGLPASSDGGIGARCSLTACIYVHYAFKIICSTNAKRPRAGLAASFDLHTSYDQVGREASTRLSRTPIAGADCRSLLPGMLSQECCSQSER